jgi:hypothetical protein
MKNMEREKFEESWKRAFEEAEVTPSGKVWTNVELDLEKAKGGELKRRLLFYQMLAAASVVFAMAIGGIGYYYSFHADRGAGSTLADNTAQTPETLSSTPQTNATAERSTGEGQNSPDDQKNAAPDSDEALRAAGGRVVSAREDRANVAAGLHDSSETTEAVSREYAAANPDLPTQLADRELPRLYAPRQVRLTFAEQRPEVDPVVAMLAKLERREKEVQAEQKKKDKDNSDSEKLWTSVGFAAGSFNTVQASTAGPSTSNGSAFALAAAAAPIVDQETRATGYSYTMGLNVGTRIAERWVLQGGVNYLTNSSEYTANNVVMESTGKFAQHRFRAASTNDLIHADEHDLNNKLVYSAPYTVNNSMRYLSIPLQAGYLLVNKTFGLQLNAGVATDLFLQNTVEGESDQLAKTSQPMGSDSPYRSVNLSGLFGTEVSYRFGPHYRVSLNPGLRYPFNTIYKSELGVRSTPLTFDVGLRFRYIFH